MGASTPIVGIPAASIAAQCLGPDIGTTVKSGDVSGALTSLENDLATIKGGSYATTATVSRQGAETYELTGYLWTKSRTIRRAAAALPHSATLHAASFVDISGGNVLRYDGGGATPNNNYLKIREGTSTLVSGIIVGDWIRFVLGPGVAGGQAYTIFREDGTTALAELWGGGAFVEFSWDGSQFRYMDSPPWVPNGTAVPGNAAYYGDGSVGSHGVVLYPANL